MKIFFILFLLSVQLSFAQDIEAILSNFVDAVSKYNIIHYRVLFSINDFSKGANSYKYDCYEKKNPSDTLTGCFYNIKGDESHCVYTGEEFYKYSPKYFGEGIVCLYNRKEHSADFGIQKVDIAGTKAIAPSVLSSHFLYPALVYRLAKYFEADSNVKKCTLLQDSIINGKACYRIEFKWKRILAIDKVTFLPVYHLEPFSNQNREAYFSDYENVKGKGSKYFSRKAIPGKMKFVYNPPRLKKKELALNALVPQWKSETIKGVKVSSESFSGKPILLVFSEIGCVPCMAAIPGLNEIAKKYMDITMLAVYPLDSREALLKLAKEKIYTYEILYNAKDIAKEYFVSAYPAFFLIGRDGKLTYSSIGWSAGKEKEIGEKIEWVLKSK